MIQNIKEKVSDLIYYIVILLIALVFILFPIKDILIKTFSPYFGRPEINQGLMEIGIVFFAGIIIIIGISNKTVKCLLLMGLALLYLQNHQFLLPFFAAILYIELIISIGTAVRRICKFRIENRCSDYLESFIFGVAFWGAEVIIFSLCEKGTFLWIRVITAGLFIISLIIYRRKPFAIYLIERYKSKENKQLILAYFLFMIVLIQGAKSYAALDYDSLWYGLHPENVLFGQNSFYDNLGMLAWVHYFPKLFELFAAPLSNLGEYSFIHAINICLYILLIITVYEFLKELKLSHIKSLFYTIVIATVPAIANYSTIAKADIFTALFTALAALNFFKAIKENDINNLSLAYAAIILSVCGKISSYPYIAILCFSGTVSYIIVYKKTLFYNLFTRKNIQCLWIMGITSIVFGGIFYRTYLLTGYPLYPFTVKLWKKLGFDGIYPFADYFGGRGAGFVKGVVFDWRFYIKHIFNLLFTPTRIREYRNNNIVANWYGNFGCFLSIVLVLNWLKKKFSHGNTINKKSDGVVLSLLLPVWLGMIIISVFLFQYAQDGNYYIVPIVLGTVCLVYLFECLVSEYKSLYYGIFIIFVVVQFAIMFVSHWSWHLGTSAMHFKLFDSSFDSQVSNREVLESSGVYDFEEYIVAQSYTESRALGSGAVHTLWRLSTGYEDIAHVMGMTKGILDSEDNLLKYLDWADVNFLIVPKENTSYIYDSDQYQNFYNVCMYFQGLNDVFILETEDYTLLDITSYTDSSNIRKEMD